LTNERPLNIRAPESDGNRLNTWYSTQMPVQRTSVRFIYQQNLTAGQSTARHAVRSRADVCTICCMQSHPAFMGTRRVPNAGYVLNNLIRFNAGGTHFELRTSGPIAAQAKRGTSSELIKAYSVLCSRIIVSRLSFSNGRMLSSTS